MKVASSDEQTTATETEETIARVRAPPPAALPKDGRMITQRVFLEVTAGELPGRKFYLTQRSYLIGRSLDADIPLADESISRIHAKVSCRNDEFVVLDLGSKNGTFLNGTNVHECPLRAGDEIAVGKHSLQFLYEATLTKD